jgi:hypothetical protein
LKRGKNYIASAARICIRKPGSTNIITLLYKLKVPHAKVSYNLAGKAETGHAGPNNQDLGIKRHRSIKSQTQQERLQKMQFYGSSKNGGNRTYLNASDPSHAPPCSPTQVARDLHSAPNEGPDIVPPDLRVQAS